jgi:hypothetical protein
MAIAEFASNTIAALSTTEWSMATNTSYDTGDAQTTDGVFQLFLDVNDMIAGDVLRIRIYEKCRSADTQRIVYEATLAGAQPTPIWASPSLVLLHGWDFTITATAGTIAVNWSIRQVS